MAEILNPYTSDPDPAIKKAVEVLLVGGVIIHQTDTIPGLACDATCASAIEKIYAIKQRDPIRPLLILCRDFDMLENHVGEIPSEVKQLLRRFVDVPITVVYPKARNLPANLPAADGSIGIRIPHHAQVQTLLTALNRPLASTSANLSGNPAPQALSNIQAGVLKLVDYVLPLRGAKKRAQNPASWVLKPENSSFRILRKGLYREGLMEWLNQQDT